jgi:hypothetical protein
MMPQWTSDDVSAFEFSTERALEKAISKQPHYVGSQNHNQVASYLQKNLKVRTANFYTRRLYLTEWEI